MKYEFTHKEGNERLLIFFAGWGMDSNVLRHISRPGYDVMVIWDYTTFHIDWSCTSPYSEICIFAWSMGVYAATLTTQALESKLTLCVAINGTVSPIDNHFGIPEDIFYGTLDNLDDRNLRKFFRRMCYERTDFTHFQEHAPARSVEDLREELQSIADSQLLHPPVHSRWDITVIGRNDRIFPFHNQLNAWRKTSTRIHVVDKGHYFDFENIVSRYLIDKPLVQTRFKAGTSTYKEHAGVQAEVADKIIELIRVAGVDHYITNSHNRVLEVGSGAGFLSARLSRYINDAVMEMWDLASPMPTGLPSNRKYTFRNCDAEKALRRCPKASFDAIFSASTIQWFNSPARFIAEVARTLAPGGYAAISSFLKGNMHQISEITGHSLPLLTKEEWEAIASEHLDIVDCVCYERDLDFETPVDVLRHLKLTGVNAVSGNSDSAAMARRVIAEYPMMLDGRYHLTYRPIIFLLHKK